MSRIDNCPNCGFRLEVRTSEQNKRLHALISDISTQMKWAGEYRDAETWKRLFVSAFERERGNSPVILPALDGHGMDFVFTRTHRMNKAEMIQMIDFVTAFALEHDVRLQDTPPLVIA